MNQKTIERILRAYSISYSHIAPPQKGYRNQSFAIDGTLNVILYKHERGMAARIKRTNNIGDFSANAGLPARNTYDRRILKLSSATHNRYVSIYYYLPGAIIPWEAYTMNHLKELGRTMSDMHAALSNYADSLPSAADECITLNKRMLGYFDDANVSQALAQKLGLKIGDATFIKILHASKRFPAQQALHLDFVRGNILFNATKVVGILDFEKAAYGSPLFDIARTLAFLLVDCKYKDEQKIRKYFLHSGYIKRGVARFKNIKIGDMNVLEELVQFFLLHDFYKFLRHNPYESLPKNEHFTRTKAMLLKHRRITTV